jgi:predicted secreted protein
MNQSSILALAIVFSSIMIVSGTNICDNTPCEPQINASVGKEVAITLESNPSTGFEWWMKFDPKYLSLLNSTSISGNGKSGMIGVPGWEMFSFNARSAGNTEVIMLLLKPWENGTIAERKIFPINIIPTATTLKQATVPNKIANLEPIKERKIVPLNVNSAASALKPATVQNKSLNPEPINIVQEQSYQEPSVMETPAQIVNRNIRAEKNPNLRGTELLNNTGLLNK